MIPAAADVKRRAVETLEGATILYDQSDCQDAVEQLVQDCGGEMEFAGSNDMWRHACIAIFPKAQAQKIAGLLSDAELTFMHTDGHNTKYNDDNGDASHVGMYIGAKAYYDDGWNKSGGWCDVFHSSASRGKVCGSNFTKNDWSHIGIAACVEYPESVYAAAGIKRLTVASANGKPVNMRKERSASSARLVSVPNGATVLATGDGEWRRIAYEGKAGYMMAEYLSDYNGGSTADVTEEESNMSLSGMTCVVVGGGLNMRKSKSTSAARVIQIPEDEVVYVYEDDGTWAKTKYDTAGTSYVGYCKSEYLLPQGEGGAEDFDGEEDSIGSDESGGEKRYGIYIPCNSLEAAKALKSILSTGSIKVGE